MSPPGSALPCARVIVYAAAVTWEAVPGSDRRLVEHLAKTMTVVWVDPPVSLWRELRQAWTSRRWPASALAAPGVMRLRTIGPPGISRPVVRAVARAQVGRRLRRYLGRNRLQAAALIGLVGQVPLRRSAGGVRMYYATDDFVAGASLMGRSQRASARAEARSLRGSDIVLAVSSVLVDKLAGTAPQVVLLANGCEPEHFRPVAGRPIPGDVPSVRPLAGYVGHIAERLDTRYLLAVVERGIDVLVIGPRGDEDPELRRQLDLLLAHPRIHWVGAKSYDDLPAYLAAIDVGLTPYGDTEFNRASFPLKTLEYLSAGRAVVSTDLPAVRWLDTEFIEVGDTPETFADHVQALVKSDLASADAQRRAFAAQHSWQSRADIVLDLIARWSPD
jgi:teichuronic acid biosynthesis glycosyltransferase TuaH